MYRYPLLCSFVLCFFLLTGCENRHFDAATVPAAQKSTELAFKRMAIHGEIEPVLEMEQKFDDWQFYVVSKDQAALPNGAPATTYSLRDQSGIDYSVKSPTNGAVVMDKLRVGAYGYASGQVIEVERDLVAGKISVTLQLSSWRERQD